MRATRKAYIAVLILSLLIANESSPFLLQPASANLLSLIPLGLRILKFLNFTTIFEAIDLLLSYLSSNHGPIKNGTVVKGISTFKYYFDLFGFLDPTFNSNSNSNFTDEFSHDLESAIKFFQKTFHLNVTGQPDNSTVDLISRRRCGLPDVIKNQTTSFTNKWKKKRNLTYAFSNDTEFPFKTTVADAFRRWSEATRLNFTEKDSVNGSDIRILQLSFGGNNSNNKGVVGGAWLDNTTMSWDVVLSSEEKWILPGENLTETKGDELDLETVVMHQIGHVLGLNHSAIEEAVMYPFVDPMKKRKVDLDEDDLEKIRKLYGEKLKSGEVVSPAKAPAAADGGGVAGVGNRWGPLSNFLWLGMIILLSCFWVNEI